VLRDSGEQNLREYLISAAARLIAERGTAGLAVRDITRTARVADGVLYNYFEDKEDLLAHALLMHVGTVMNSLRVMPEPGTGTLADNLRQFVGNGLDVLTRVSPAFAGLVTQPNVLVRFRTMIGGARAFEPSVDGGEEQRGLPVMLARYLAAEQRIGRIDASVDVVAAAAVVVDAIHGQVLPQVLFSPPGTAIRTSPDFADRLVTTVLNGIARG
jgi:AcrR family transcriptional regulator